MLLPFAAFAFSLAQLALAADEPIKINDELTMQPLAVAVVMNCEAPPKHPTLETHPAAEPYARGFFYGTKMAFDTFETKADRDAAVAPPSDGRDINWLTVQPDESDDKALRYLGGGGTIDVSEIPTLVATNLEAWGNFPFYLRFERRDYDSDYSGPFYEKHGYVTWYGNPVVYTCQLVPGAKK